MANNEIINAFIYVEHGKEIVKTKKARQMKLSGVANSGTILGYGNYLWNGHGYNEYTARDSARVNPDLDEEWARDPVTISSEGKLKTKEERKAFAKKMSEAFNEDGNLCWMPIISLQDYDVAKNFALFNDEDYSAVVNDFLPRWFRSVHLDPNNMMWFVDYHNNTDNPHLHFCFAEIEQTRTRGKFTKTEMNNFRLQMAASTKRRARTMGYIKEDVEKSKLLHKAMDASKAELKESITQTFLSDIQNTEIEKEIVKLYSSIDKNLRTGRLSYNSKNMAPFKSGVDKITTLLLTHPNNQKLYDDLQKSWIDLDAFSKGDIISDADAYVKSEEGKLYTEVGNMILKNKKEWDKQRRADTLKEKLAGIEPTAKILEYRDSRAYDSYIEEYDATELESGLKKHPYWEFHLKFENEDLERKCVEVFESFEFKNNDFLIFNIDDDHEYSFEVKLTEKEMGKYPYWSKEEIGMYTIWKAQPFLKSLVNNIQDEKISVEEAKAVYKGLEEFKSITSFQKYMMDYTWANKDQPDNPFYREPKYTQSLNHYARSTYGAGLDASFSYGGSLANDISNILNSFSRNRIGAEVQQAENMYWQDQTDRSEKMRKQEEEEMMQYYGRII